MLNWPESLAVIILVPEIGRSSLLKTSFPHFNFFFPQSREELFLVALCLCHTVQAQYKDKVDSGKSRLESSSPKYVSSSPDEIALLTGARK